MKQILLKGGKAILDDVPSPIVDQGCILVSVRYSCVSVGTEAANISQAAEPLYMRAIKQPEKVLRAFAMMKEQGIERTFERISGIHTSSQPVGYSAAGVVVAIGRDVEGFKIGDRVACAGAGIANHAEVICVPVNLAVHVPDNLDLSDASTVTIGAIALQGVRRTSPALGEVIAVIGLGIIGQLTIQLLKANGCRVIGIDPDTQRLEVARACGLDQGLNPKLEDVVTQILWSTNGLGADAVIVTAAAASHEIISEAMRACRKKGRVVLVGDVGLNLKREDFYRKELDFLVSTSYGPGRYDPYYEEGGQDYPVAYVRWTENRNMGAYLQLLGEQKLVLQPLKPEIIDIDEAEGLYSRLQKGQDRPLLALLRYSNVTENATQKRLIFSPINQRTGRRIRVALIGAGGFAQGVHLPNLATLRDRYEVRWVVSRTGSSAETLARKYEAQFAGTNYQAVLEDSDVDLVLISTRHHLHAALTLEALQANKHVFVEKPLALNEAELKPIEDFYQAEGCKPLLMVGYNRRHSPGIQRIKNILSQNVGPMMISYRMNAGYLPPDHWVHGPEGGGRNIGEACHIYDLFTHLVGSEPVSCSAIALDHLPAGCRANENFIATIKYKNGSVATLHYTSLGSALHSKEKMDIYTNDTVISIDDYKNISIFGGRSKGWESPVIQKGLLEELVSLADLVQHPSESYDLELRNQFATSHLSFSIEQQLKIANQL